MGYPTSPLMGRYPEIPGGASIFRESRQVFGGDSADL